MLVVISDLHFVDGTSGDHNLPTDAFESVFLSDVIALARTRQATELKLLLLGDIPDLIRSEQWFLEQPEDRPWGANGLQDLAERNPDSRTEERCLEILGRFPADGHKSSVPRNTILFQNWETFAFFRELPQIVRRRLGRDIPVEIIYVVGNHDRLVNVYPSLRDELRKIMGLSVSGDTVVVTSPWEWWYPYSFMDEDYSVFARHGHQYDPWNYGGRNDFTRVGHLTVPVGDPISTEFAVNLPRTLATLRDKYPAISDQLIAGLKDVDNVRPLGRILEWFHYRIKMEHSSRVRQALDETFDRVLDEFLQVDYVQQWRSPQTHWDEIARASANPWVRRFVHKVTSVTNTADLLYIFLPALERNLRSESSQQRYSEAAYRESIWRENPEIRYVLYGHTHRPLLQPLDGSGGRNAIYLNTGTWRSHIYRTIALDESADFLKLKQMTFVCFYNRKEDADNKVPGTVSFDVWTGHRHKYYADAPAAQQVSSSDARQL